MVKPEQDSTVLKIPLLILVTLFLGISMALATEPSTSSTTTYHRTIVDGVGIFYREPGTPSSRFYLARASGESRRHCVARLTRAFLKQTVK